jgi:glycosyltransferase involved in cell wall biosynthesis
MKFTIITAQAPFGRGETFIIEEIIFIKKAGFEPLIIPRNPPKKIFHKKANLLLPNAIQLPLFNLKIIRAFLFAIFHKEIWHVILSISRHSRKTIIFIKNLAVIPKGIFIAGLLKKEDIKHIHAHWGSTTATMAYVTSKLSGIPWSLTLHRWDIKENNMLKEKVNSAKFIRCISKDGKNELIKLIDKLDTNKIKVIHMGVEIPKERKFVSGPSEENFIIVCPGSLIPRKGHRFFIDACSILVQRGVSNFQAFFVGEGPLEDTLLRQIIDCRLEKQIKLIGFLAHEKLLEMYKNDEVDVVVLPSLHEGIPVSLMEAMAYGIPVVSTNSGGTPELLSNGAGMLTEPGDSEQLAQAIQQLMLDTDLRTKLSEKGHKKVRTNFNVEKNVMKLLSLMSDNINEQ